MKIIYLRHLRNNCVYCINGLSRGRKFHLTLSDGRWSGIAQIENTVRHTKYGHIRGMVVGEGGSSTGVLL